MPSVVSSSSSGHFSPGAIGSGLARMCAYLMPTTLIPFRPSPPEWRLT